MVNSTQKSLRIVIAGGNGFLGLALIRHFKLPAEFVILSRKMGEKIPGAKVVWWDGEHSGGWFREIDGADLLLNFSGRTVDCRYTEKNKKEILDSRIKSTSILGEAIKQAAKPPQLWINAGSATLYRDSKDKDMDEFSGEEGTGFSVDVCRAWEQSFNNCLTPSTRKIVLRIAMVLGADKGVVPVLINLAKKGLGGRYGNGTQYMSWIHEKDFVRVVESCIENTSWTGAFNCTAPHPIPNADFMKQIRRAAKINWGLPAAKWMLEIGALFLRTETELVLKSRRVIPARLMKNGFAFEFTTAEAAIADLIKIN
jgi:uncharacterized protein (TIGR01777 family)